MIIQEHVIKRTRNVLINLLKENPRFLSGQDSSSQGIIERFQAKNNLLVDGIFGEISMAKLWKLILQPKKINGFEDHYFKRTHKKSQIILHHAASSDSAEGIARWWRTDGVQHVATPGVITDTGEYNELFDTNYWAYSIGLKTNYKKGITKRVRSQLERGAVAIEIANAGRLTKNRKGLYKTWFGRTVNPLKVIELDYKGYKYYERYTDEEVRTLKYWILLVSIKHNIPLTYSHSDFWEYSENAIKGVPGIYTHNSYRKDKTDISPQGHMIKMLQSLAIYEKNM